MVVIEPPIVQKGTICTAAFLRVAHGKTKPLPHIVDVVVTTATQAVRLDQEVEPLFRIQLLGFSHEFRPNFIPVTKDA